MPDARLLCSSSLRCWNYSGSSELAAAVWSTVFL